MNDENYTGWNAIADILDAYWKNKAAQDAQEQPSGNGVSVLINKLSSVGIDPAKEMPNILRRNPNFLGAQDASQPILNTSGQFFPNTDSSFSDWAKR